MFRYESRAVGGPMQTLSSASRTCMASASAVECTATVAMPSSLHARSTRNAISPRLAIRIFSNMAWSWFVSRCSTKCCTADPGPFQGRHLERSRVCGAPFRFAPCCAAPGTRLTSSFYDHERLTELDRLAVLDQDLDDGAGARRLDLVHGLHRLDDEQRVASAHPCPHFDEWARAR